MRVLQLVTQSRGGPVDHAVEVAAELTRHGHESHLVGPAGAYLDAAARRGVRTHVAEMRTKTDVAGARALAAVRVRVRPDVVHLQDRRAGLVGRALAGWRGVPSVYTLHGVPDELAGLVPGNLPPAPARTRDRWARLVPERLLATAPRSVVVTPCEALRTFARDHVGLPGDRVHTVHNGVAAGWSHPAASGARSVATSGVAGDGVRVTWLGMMQPIKRVPDLVHAAAAVPGIELELVGDGPERGRIEAAVDATGSRATVRFEGFQADPAPYLRRTDILVLPSAAEACPMALLQAMACGVPVIATRVGGVPEIVRDGIDGLLVDAGAVDQLTAALARLTGDGDLRRTLGAAARARVVDRFGIDRNVRSLIAIYEELAS